MGLFRGRWRARVQVGQGREGMEGDSLRASYFFFFNAPEQGVEVALRKKA